MRHPYSIFGAEYSKFVCFSSFIFLDGQENEAKEAARATGHFLRFSPSARFVELAALKQPQTQHPQMAAMLGPVRKGQMESPLAQSVYGAVWVVN